MVVRIVLDTREDALKEILSGNGIEVKQLSVGDIHFVDEQERECIIFERKTAGDLYSSIISGRFAEQRERLKRMCLQNVKVCYIIEDFSPTSVWAMDDKKKKVMYGALENLVLYHNMFVLHTWSVKQTGECLVHMLKKVNDKPVTLHTAFEPSVVLNQTKKRTLTTENLLPNMLTVIPGISETSANAIAKDYPTFPDLSKAWLLKDTVQEKMDMLKDIQVGKKKLGKVTSARIYNIFNS